MTRGAVEHNKDKKIILIFILNIILRSIHFFMSTKIYIFILIQKTIKLKIF